MDTINRQAVLCHRVLRTLQQVARGPVQLERETWQSLLLFLIGINDALLAPPAVREDAGEQLCERVLGVLLEVHFHTFLNSAQFESNKSQIQSQFFSNLLIKLDFKKAML